MVTEESFLISKDREANSSFTAGFHLTPCLIRSHIRHIFVLYRSIDVSLVTSGSESKSASSTEENNWREKALQEARSRNCAYLFLTNSDELLMEFSLKQLIELKLVVVSPLMNPPLGSGGPSNVHGLLGNDFVFREKIELIRVYYAKSPLLLHLKHTDASYLTFDADNLRDTSVVGKGPIDVFAHSAFSMNISIFITNRHFYGYFVDSSAYTRTQHIAIVSIFYIV